MIYLVRDKKVQGENNADDLVDGEEQDSANGLGSQIEEGELCNHQNLDSKSFGAQASKFQTQPNKKKNKVIIVDEEDEEEFGLNASINNHISIGSIEDQEQRLIMLQ